MENDMLDFELKNYINDSKELKKEELDQKKEELRITMLPLVKNLRDAKKEKEDMEVKFNVAKEKLNEIESEIRRIWGPYIEGVDKAEIEIDGSRLESKTMINVKPLSDTYLDWLAGNGYKDVMKWQVHHQTFKSIANKLYKEGIKIPDVEYIRFNKISLK